MRSLPPPSNDVTMSPPHTTTTTLEPQLRKHDENEAAGKRRPVGSMMDEPSLARSQAGIRQKARAIYVK